MVKIDLNKRVNSFKDPIYWVTNNETLETNEGDNLKILSNLNEKQMIDFMLKSKVILIPSSVLSFEAISLRKPIYSCFFVNNQKLIYESLVKMKLSEGYGYIETKEDVALATKSFLSYYIDNNKHKKQIKNQELTIDGCSSERIKNVLLLN